MKRRKANSRDKEVSSPSSKMAMNMKESGFSSLNEDLIYSILNKLPAIDFASAACVNKSWNCVCSRILSTPKIASAVSLNPSRAVAFEEVVSKVLSEPIRPHFAIANVCSYNRCPPSYDDLNYLVQKLGRRTPIVMTSPGGVMGRDANTDEFVERMIDEWRDYDVSEDHLVVGIVLTVGYLPGLQVDAIPLLQEKKKEPKAPMVDNFVMDIRNYSLSVSGSNSPTGIVMFADSFIGLRSTIETLDYAMSKETIIVGDHNTHFIYRSGSQSSYAPNIMNCCCNAVALVFARDRNRPLGVGEIQFHASLSNGVSAIGPRYKAASVRAKNVELAVWLTARREGEAEILDGERILDQVIDEFNNLDILDLYIGVTRRRRRCVGSEKSRIMTTLSFYGVESCDEEYLYVHGEDIKTGDTFRFYHSNSSTALSSSANVSANFRNMKLNNVGKTEYIGGLIFSCCGRGDSFFGGHKVDSSPLLENFPGMPLAGIFCGGEIGRSLAIMNVQEGEEDGNANVLLHVYSSVYLLISYTPTQQEQ